MDAVLPDRSEAAVRPVLEGKLSKDDTLLRMDGHKALIAFAEAEGIEGEHVHEEVPHIRLWRALQTMAQPLQRRRHQISAQLPRLASLAGKGGGHHNATNRPCGSTWLKPTQNSDRAKRNGAALILQFRKMARISRREHCCAILARWAT